MIRTRCSPGVVSTAEHMSPTIHSWLKYTLAYLVHPTHSSKYTLSPYSNTELVHLLTCGKVFCCWDCRSDVSHLERLWTMLLSRWHTWWTTRTATMSRPASKWWRFADDTTLAQPRPLLHPLSSPSTIRYNGWCESGNILHSIIWFVLVLIISFCFNFSFYDYYTFIKGLIIINTVLNFILL